MNRLLFPLLLSFLLLSCHGSTGDDLSHESVRRAAQDYYMLLIQGHYEQFVSGMADTDSIPASYRSQLIDMVAQHVAEQEQKNGELLQVVATADSLRDSTAFVFLDLHYADNLVEQIMVPMVFQRDRWRMR